MISFVIPVYNAEAFLSVCIESLLAQDSAQWEAVFVDDGSSDGSLDVIRSYDDPRLIIIAQNHAGPAAARIAGVACAKGDYIVFLDADDRVAPSSVRLLLDAPRSDVLCFQAWKEREGKAARLLMDPKISSPREFSDAILHRRALGCLWNKRFHRSLFSDAIFCPRGGYGEDRILLIQLVERASGEIRYLDAPLYFYKKFRSGSLTRVGRHARKIAEGRNYMDFYRAVGKKKYHAVAIRLLIFRDPRYLF